MDRESCSLTRRYLSHLHLNLKTLDFWNYLIELNRFLGHRSRMAVSFIENVLFLNFFECSRIVSTHFFVRCFETEAGHLSHLLDIAYSHWKLLHQCISAFFPTNVCSLVCKMDYLQLQVVSLHIHLQVRDCHVLVMTLSLATHLNPDGLT